MIELPPIVGVAIVVAALLLTVYDSVKPAFHKAKCGIIHVVGKHCEDDKDKKDNQ